MSTRIQDIAAFSQVREAGLAKLLPSRPRIGVGMGTCGSGNGAEAVYHAFSSEIESRGLDVQLAPVGCFGFCAEEPLVNVWVPGRPLLMLHRVQPNHVDGILNGLGQGRLPPPEIVLCKIEEWDHLTGHVKYGYGYPELPHWHEVPFFKGQVKIVLRNCGLINPDDIEEYIAVGGYQSLYKVLIDQNPQLVIEQVKAAKLRGRGGAAGDLPRCLLQVRHDLFLAFLPSLADVGCQLCRLCRQECRRPGNEENSENRSYNVHAVFHGRVPPARNQRMSFSHS